MSGGIVRCTVLEPSECGALRDAIVDAIRDGVAVDVRLRVDADRPEWANEMVIRWTIRATQHLDDGTMMVGGDGTCSNGTSISSVLVRIGRERGQAAEATVVV